MSLEPVDAKGHSGKESINDKVIYSENRPFGLPP